MVHFPPLPSPAYEFSGRYSGMSQSGFPHSEIPGSKPACGSPRLIAACHVLHRLLAPRHSPYALSSLTKCSLHLTACDVVKKLPIAEYSVVKKQTCVRLRRLLRLACSAEALSRLASSSQTLHFAKAGGEYRDRTGDLLVANQALSQLS
jgi:hypothetical protein